MLTKHKQLNIYHKWKECIAISWKAKFQHNRRTIFDEYILKLGWATWTAGSAEPDRDAGRYCGSLCHAALSRQLVILFIIFKLENSYVYSIFTDHELHHADKILLKRATELCGTTYQSSIDFSSFVDSNIQSRLDVFNSYNTCATRLQLKQTWNKI